MHKNRLQEEQRERPRVLARLLAEELKDVRVSGGVGQTIELFRSSNGNLDATNYGGDGDGPFV